MTTRYVPVRDLARLLGCGQKTVRRLLREGTVPGIKVGRDWRADPAQVVLALSNRRPQGPKAE
jgi:excisionase family DNA binding protein